MVTNLEGLIERIVLLSSCAGEQGCLATELLASTLVLLSICESEPSQDEVFQILEDSQSDAYRTTAVIWKWMGERKDVSVGEDRRYNDTSLNNILALAQKSSVVATSANTTPSEKNVPAKDGLRIHVSEDTMWESLAGHGVDHKRIPRSEWILLQGIASTKTEGILQGDLGRLVGQDKRSVPKRTSCLVEKGYITKRTTLVRGTKTSKLWLKFLAPATPEDSTETSETETAITLSRHCLVDNLAPVPWNTRWTGDSIDYKVLATTIMAICKEWNVMRLQDLKSKLGVLGMTWQMKVVSKICRFLNARGTIQYVAAKLNNRIFKDCIRFNREMNARDWSIFLATGKRTTKSTKNLAQEHGEDEAGTIGVFKGTHGAGGFHTPSWSIYIPIATLVALCIQESGGEGLTNPQLCAMTIGSSFTRYLAGLTASISSDNIQPSNVKHLAISSERGRPGKSSSLYWYFMAHSETHSGGSLSQPIHEKSKTKGEAKNGNLSEPYNFTPLAHQSSSSDDTPTLSSLCQRGLSQQKKRGRPKKTKSESRSNANDVLPQVPMLTESSIPRRTRGASVQPETLHIEEQARSEIPRDETQNRKKPAEATDSDTGGENRTPEQTTRVRGRPRIRGDGQAGRKPRIAKALDSGSNRQFRCEKCSGTWKNDVGLKYHLEKSQTPCNPSFKPQLVPTPKKMASFASSSRPASQAKKFTKRTYNDDTGEVSADGRGVQVEPIGRGKANRRREEPASVSTHFSRRKRPDTFDSSNATEDMNILSGQAELLRATSALTPRQVDPFTKASSRQPSIHHLSTGMGEDSADSTNLPELQEVPVEATDAHRQDLTLDPQISTSATGNARETLEEPGPGPKSSIRHKLMNTIVELLYQHSGALPAGQSLEILLCEKWKSQHQEEDIPSGARIKSAMLQLIREKKIVDQWHAFRAPDGRIGKCQIITIPSLMAFAPETRTLVEAIRQLYPANILPHQLPGIPCLPEDVGNSKEECDESEETNTTKVSQSDTKAGGRGRRSLAADVAILNAPVYAAQVITKRAAEPNDIQNSSPGKRRRTGEAFAHTMDEHQIQPFWPIAGNRPPHTAKNEIPYGDTAVTLDIAFNGLALSSNESTGTGAPLWPRNKETQIFERLARSMHEEGWIDGSKWFSWASYNHMSSQTRQITHADRSQLTYLVDKLKMCLNAEIEADYSISLPTEAHSIFINFVGGDAGNHIQMPNVQWHTPDKRRSITPRAVAKADDEESELSSASADEAPEMPPTLLPKASALSSATPQQAMSTPIKRATLKSRKLTALPLNDGQRSTVDQCIDPDSNELAAAFVVIRSLLGGVDKVIDWGLLTQLFPTVGLPSLRRFWAKIRKEKASFLSKATQDFQESLITAIQNDEIAIPDYEQPSDYDWKGLIHWAMRHPNQEQLHLPISRERFHQDFKLIDGSDSYEDWKEKFFHPQSSVYSRFESATLQGGSLTAIEAQEISQLQPSLSTVDIARSWIRSLCCTSETEYTPQDVKERFSKLSQDTPQQNSLVLKTAIDQLTRERVICKSKRTPFGGRPYRLNEGYTTVLTKVAHRQKYLDAIAFKKDLDKAFRSSSTMRVPYTLSDGAMMALTNLIANARIKITATTVPNIPFGFEPGNYESRKYPKSYYHLDLEVEPTLSYLFNNDIDILGVVQRTGPPREGRAREIPQWIDFFGKLDEQRWADILGAVCFAFSTRGIMSVTGICDAVTPILDVFEARLIISWGLGTGIFVRDAAGSDIALGEWWWLVAQRLRD